MNTSWSEFSFRVNVNAALDKVYRAWVTPAGLESWFLRSAKGAAGQSFAKGDGYEWSWHGYPDATHQGKILDANGEDVFRFTFSKGCSVEISLHREFDETIVTLRESDLPTDEETIRKHYLGDSKGWVFYLTNLKSVLEGGLDLRNRKQELKNVITA